MYAVNDITSTPKPRVENSAQVSSCYLKLVRDKIQIFNDGTTESGLPIFQKDVKTATKQKYRIICIKA